MDPLKTTVRIIERLLMIIVGMGSNGSVHGDSYDVYIVVGILCGMTTTDTRQKVLCVL